MSRQWLPFSVASTIVTVWYFLFTHCDFAMDLQAYSWACGSSIRAISGTEGTLNQDPTQDEESVQPTHAQGLLSLWAAAVHVAAAQGNVEDIESELGPAVSLRAEREPVPMFASIDETEDGCQKIDSPQSQDTEKKKIVGKQIGYGFVGPKERRWKINSSWWQPYFHCSISWNPKRFSSGQRYRCRFFGIAFCLVGWCSSFEIIGEGSIGTGKVLHQAKQKVWT